MVIVVMSYAHAISRSFDFDISDIVDVVRYNLITIYLHTLNPCIPFVLFIVKVDELFLLFIEK